MKTVEFLVTGISPLLMNNPEAMTRGGATLGRKVIPTPQEEAESKAYRLPSADPDQPGQLYIRATALRSSVIDAGMGLRIGRSSASKIIGASVFVVDDQCPLVHPETGTPLTEFEIDIQRAVVANAGVMRARPRLPRWQTTVAFEYDEQFVTLDILKQAFAIGGRTVGVGDFRPRCPKGKGGPFGRYSAEMLG